MREQGIELTGEVERIGYARDRLRTSARHTALEHLIQLIEHELPAMRGSVLIFDDASGTLRHCAAPSLPEDYTRLIDGAPIGPAAGSCGTAAYRREQVIVRDIASDPLWSAYRACALPFGLRACWSTPIFDERHTVVGTFAMYYDEPRLPTERELGLTRTATMLASDIIVRARAEEALLASEAAMRAAHAAAAAANQSKAAFMAMMSHELRTPLNAIGGYATLMLDGIPDPATPAQQSYLRRILVGQQHLLGLIDAVLTHAKLEAGAMAYRPEDVRIGELLDAVESLSRPQCVARDVTYDCSGCDSRLVVHADRQKTVQVLLNLLSNAVKFTPAQGRITVGTAVAMPGSVRISVRDTGIGMTEDQLASVFEPYVQVGNRLTEHEEGTGLGLSISRTLARGMGGDLAAESEAGVGTEFVLSLPAHTDQTASSPSSA